MKVCIVAEGCYPYVVGGVSGWINSLIRSFPNVEFILLAIVANRSFRGKFVYELPENLTQVYGALFKNIPYLIKNAVAMLGRKKIYADKLLWRIMSDRVSLKLQRKKDGRIIHFANKNSTDTLYLGSLHCGKIYLSEE